MQEPLARRVGNDADAKQIAAAVFAVWEEIDDALTPIVGTQGVVALYRRSLHLAVAQHPWLAGRDDGILTDTDPAVLRSVLAQRSSIEAAAGGNAFLNTFHELLTQGHSSLGQDAGALIGRELTLSTANETADIPEGLQWSGASLHLSGSDALSPLAVAFSRLKSLLR